MKSVFATFAVLYATPIASAAAQDALSAGEMLIAYCHGAASSQLLAVDILIEDACKPTGTPARCQEIKTELGDRQAKVRRSLQELNDALFERGLVGEGEWIGWRGKTAGQHARAQSRQGAGEVLACLGISLPSMPKPQVPKREDSCDRIWRKCAPPLTG